LCLPRSLSVVSSSAAVSVHLLGHHVHSQQPYTGDEYKLEAEDCIVPVAQAILVAAPQGGSAKPAVPPGCVLVRQVQRLQYGGEIVRIPEGGFGFRWAEPGMCFAELEEQGWTGGEEQQSGFVPLDVMDSGQRHSSGHDDVAHAPPDELFIVPEWWVQPASYFASAPRSAKLEHHNDSNCAKSGCRERDELYLCDHCPRAYHLACLSEKRRCAATQAQADEWRCPECS
jgi:hypothetical protein